MPYFVQVKGTVRDLGGNRERRVFVVAIKGTVPHVEIANYLYDYLDAGTREECENHPALRDFGNQAGAVLTWRYLRPVRQACLDDRESTLLDVAPTGTPIHSDELCDIYEVSRANE